MVSSSFLKSCNAFLFSFLLVLSVFLTRVAGAKFNYVTCGSALKLLHIRYQVRLHSHEVKYGSGSGQQSVTGVESLDDVNSHWLIKGIAGKRCVRGEPIECGKKIRFEHLTTKRNLHSHLFSAPLSGSQEVSAFGEGGDGDTGDFWEVICDGEYWQREKRVMFKHVDTSMYLGASGHTYGRPIHGQMEICAISQPDTSVHWQVSEGVFVKPTSFNEPAKKHEHTEL